MERRIDAPIVIDGMAADLGGPRTASFHEKVERAINVEALADSIRTVVASEQPGGGRPLCPVSVMPEGSCWLGGTA